MKKNLIRLAVMHVIYMIMAGPSGSGPFGCFFCGCETLAVSACLPPRKRQILLRGALKALKGPEVNCS